MADRAVFALSPCVPEAGYGTDDPAKVHDGRTTPHLQSRWTNCRASKPMDEKEVVRVQRTLRSVVMAYGSCTWNGSQALWLRQRAHSRNALGYRCRPSRPLCRRVCVSHQI